MTITAEQLARLRTLTRQAKDATPDWYGFSRFVDSVVTPTDAEYIAASSPDVVLALLDEIEQYRKDWDAMLIEVARAVGDDDEREAAEMVELEELDPWHMLRRHRARHVVTPSDGGGKEGGNGC